MKKSCFWCYDKNNCNRYYLTKRPENAEACRFWERPWWMFWGPK